MKKVLWGFILSAGASLIWSAGACATTYTITDKTLSYWGQSNNTPLKPAGTSATSGLALWSDVIGAKDFDTFSIDVNFSNDSVFFDIFTNLNFGTYTPADLALSVDGDDTYEYGVVLQAHDGLTTGLYSVPQSNGWKTSYDYFNSIGGPVSYGQKYSSNLQNLTPYSNSLAGYPIYHSSTAPADTKDPVVAIKPASTLLIPAFGINDWGGTNWSGSGNGIDDPFFRYSFSFDLSNLPNLGNQIHVFWGTALCGNDVIEGQVPVPEPATLMLLGTGLAGLMGIRSKRFRKPLPNNA